MLSRIFAWFLIITFSPLKIVRPLLLLMMGSWCLSLLGCPQPCPPCLSSVITLPVEMAPLLRPVTVTKLAAQHPELKGFWLLDEQSRKNILIDIELLRAFGYANQAIIEKYNEAAK